MLMVPARARLALFGRSAGLIMIEDTAHVIGAKLHPFADLIHRRNGVGAARLDGKLGPDLRPAAFDRASMALGQIAQPLSHRFPSPFGHGAIGRHADDQRRQTGERQHRGGKPDPEAEQVVELRHDIMSNFARRHPIALTLFESEPRRGPYRVHQGSSAASAAALPMIVDRRTSAKAAKDRRR